MRRRANELSTWRPDCVPLTECCLSAWRQHLLHNFLSFIWKCDHRRCDALWQQQRDPGGEACSVPCSQTRMGLLFGRFKPKQRAVVVVIIDFISAAQLFLHPVCVYVLWHPDESGTCNPLKEKKRKRSVWFRSSSLYKAGRGTPWLKTKRLGLITAWVWSCFYHYAPLSLQ